MRAFMSSSPVKKHLYSSLRAVTAHSFDLNYISASLGSFRFFHFSEERITSEFRHFFLRSFVFPPLFLHPPYFKFAVFAVSLAPRHFRFPFPNLVFPRCGFPAAPPLPFPPNYAPVSPPLVSLPHPLLPALQRPPHPP